ncbi:3-phosphoinositide-dependent protein kinase 1 isoform X1 [Aphis craccivora]|uniref:3-phosphoinositide-dependent protein kinase 1 isoform X1 n=1 Tax=Aphis craccivora TaxID=307492 RepID=A0A6G0ZI30_APHCR|nr:3-phosphoinositide-dependent protein kinase 1 isoform X1 [Aphis craccivora]
MDTKTSTYHLTHHHHHLHQQTKKQTSATAVIVRSRPVQFAQTLARVFRIGRKEKISKKAANKVCGQDDQFIFKLFSTQSRFRCSRGAHVCPLTAWSNFLTPHMSFHIFSSLFYRPLKFDGQNARHSRRQPE